MEAGSCLFSNTKLSEAVSFDYNKPLNYVQNNFNNTLGYIDNYELLFEMYYALFIKSGNSKVLKRRNMCTKNFSISLIAFCRLYENKAPSSSG